MTSKDEIRQACDTLIDWVDRERYRAGLDPKQQSRARWLTDVSHHLLDVALDLDEEDEA